MKAIRMVIEEIGNDDQPKQIFTRFSEVPEDYRRNRTIQGLLEAARKEFAVAFLPEFPAPEPHFEKTSQFPREMAPEVGLEP
jgi:hypothetical protein